VENSVHTQLHHLINLAHERQLAQIAALPDAERDEIGTPERWSAKDHLAHTMYWKQRLAERLRVIARGETMQAWDESAVQGINESTFETNRHRSWADVLADDARIHVDLTAAVEALSEADLAEPDRFPWNRDGEPLLTDVLGNPYWHVQDHLAQYARDRGDPARARQIHEGWVATVNQSGLPDVARGISVYNLACFYALNGDPDAALRTLAEALRLTPRLTEWSKQDPDFASLRDDPTYQALYTG